MPSHVKNLDYVCVDKLRYEKCDSIQLNHKAGLRKTVPVLLPTTTQYKSIMLIN